MVGQKDLSFELKGETRKVPFSDLKIVAERHVSEPQLKECLKWKGEGPAPKYWFATTEHGILVQVFRSYEDYRKS